MQNPSDPAIAALLLAMAFAVPRFGLARLEPAVLAFKRLARNPLLSIAFVGFTAFAANAALSTFVRAPVPAIHDEYSYLLAADTFAHGRLTTPTHPMWRHFESWHIIHRPSYQSKYPPAQGLAIAAGQKLFARPIVGVWLTEALACAALCWMLQAWMPRRWALLGGLLAACNAHILTAWGQTYWGGALAMLGGALVFGALRRIVRRPHIGHALLLAVGLAVLANSRPYEGFVCSLPALAVLAIRMLGRRRPPWRVSLLRIVLPVLAVLVPTVAWMGYYNHRVTGDATRMPYQVWKETYSIRPSLTGTLLFGERPRTDIPTEELERMRRLGRNQDLPNEVAHRTIPGQAIEAGEKLKTQWLFYLGALLAIPLVTIGSLWKDRWIRFAVLVIAMAQVALILQQNSGFPHYTAPAAALVFLVVVQGLRRMRHWRFGGEPSGAFLLRALPLGYLATLVIFVATCWKPPHWGLERARLEKLLASDSERHLVIVRYDRHHSPDEEYVYNAADIDGAKTVWAHELEPAEDLQLLAHFKNRRVWLLEPDKAKGAPLSLAPYPGPGK